MNTDFFRTMVLVEIFAVGITVLLTLRDIAKLLGMIIDEMRGDRHADDAN